MAEVNRSLKDKAMDKIDHALGRPVNPMGETYRNYFATDDEDQFRENPQHWILGNTTDHGMHFFHVTSEGKAALRDYLKAQGNQHRKYIVTHRDDGACTVVATSRSKAKYEAWMIFNDVNDCSFFDFCKSVSVKLA